VLTGGRRNPDLKGLYIQPTVLTDVDHSMKIMSEETFGPIIPIVAVDSEAEAIEMANDTAYGLSSTVWSGDVERAERVADQLHAGSTCINDMAVTYGVPQAPFGGRKDSGVGVANGPAGLRGFCHPQPVIVDRLGGKQAAATYPYRFKNDKVTQRIIKVLWGTRLGHWLS
jgi:succinate-semialdehyde dehydrogenase/glutarate-semialdehyde dehydrogenase